jgi:hypothetical protein
MHEVNVCYYDSALPESNRPTFRIRTAHLVTPETQTSMHYFIAPVIIMFSASLSDAAQCTLRVCGVCDVRLKLKPISLKAAFMTHVWQAHLGWKWKLDLDWLAVVAVTLLKDAGRRSAVGRDNAGKQKNDA